MRASLEELQTAIGYRFENAELLERALTHYSFVYESLPAGTPRTALRDNEQLEFLGDAILGFLVSDRLLREFPEFAEGKLSERKAQFVSAAYLLAVARRLNIGSYLFLGKGEESTGGREKNSLLADALEALIAAIYLDGGLPAAHAFLNGHVLPETLADLSDGSVPRPDFRNALQEMARARNLPEPRYDVSRQTGPAYAKVFTVQVSLGPHICANGDGSSKKSASQRAAQNLYERLTAPAHGSTSTSPSL